MIKEGKSCRFPNEQYWYRHDSKPNIQPKKQPSNMTNHTVTTKDNSESSSNNSQPLQTMPKANNYKIQNFQQTNPSPRPPEPQTEIKKMMENILKQVNLLQTQMTIMS